MTNIRSEKGFTLVELAVVMIIIGLLIGGVLKGQELIKSAKVTSTISQIKGIDAAVSTFQDIYAGLPGDLPNPDTRLPGCTGVCVTTSTWASIGNGLVDEATAFDPAATPADGSEAVAFFAQLAAADLISGVTPGDDTFGGNYPQAPVGGGFVAQTVANVTDMPGNLSTELAPAGNGAFRAGLYLMHQQAVGSLTNLPVSNPLTMQRIDRKVDDGNPLTGSVYAAETTTGSCGATITGSTSAANAYNTANSSLVCNAVIRIQN